MVPENWSLELILWIILSCLKCFKHWCSFYIDFNMILFYKSGEVNGHTAHKVCFACSADNSSSNFFLFSKENEKRGQYRRARNNWRVISQKNRKTNLTRPGHFYKFDYSKFASDINQLLNSHKNLVYQGSFENGFMWYFWFWNESILKICGQILGFYYWQDLCLFRCFSNFQKYG